MHVLKKLAVALALAFPVAAMAAPQSTKELRAELDALKEHVRKLEAMIEKAAKQAEAADGKASAAATTAQAANVKADQVDKAQANAVDLAEFNRVRIKTEAMEDATEASGFKSLKVSGYIDPSYINNRNAKTSSFMFLNNNSAVSGSPETFGYDNTFFGSGMLNIEKELDGGTKVKIGLMPSKSASAGYNFGNMVHEASVSVPLGDLSTRLLVGQFPDWTGYEYIASTQNKLITHNLMFDFSAANFYTGVGVQLYSGKWDTKIMVGNMNSARIDASRNRTPGLFYRVDYAKGEYNGFGFSGIHSGFSDPDVFGRLDLLEIDGYFTRGDWNFQGQLGVGRQSATAYNAYNIDKQRWWGLSGLMSHKITSRLEAIARLDYISNSRGGGGVFGSTLVAGVCHDTTGADANCPDGRNGFGSHMLFDGSEWVVQDPSRGSNRSALSMGLNYALMPGVNLKGEYRYDRSTGNVFITSDGNYRRDNHVLGVSTVVSF